MTKPAAIAGTFSDLKTVKTRSVVQMIIEVPIEHGEQIIAAFGFPRPGDEVPVAVARLDPEKAKATPVASKKPRRPFHELPLSQQAGIRCQDEGFRNFLSRMKFWQAATESEAAEYLYSACGVESRAFLDTNEQAGKVWQRINTAYEQWAGLQAESR